MPKLLITQKTGWNVFIELDGAVGRRGPNNSDDVLVVSVMLAHIQRAVRSFGPTQVLPRHSCDPNLIKAIEEYQRSLKEVLHADHVVCDGVIDPMGDKVIPFDRALGHMHNEVLGGPGGGNTVRLGWPGALFAMYGASIPKISTKF